MVDLVATVVIAEKVDPEEEEDTLEVEDIPEAVVEVDRTVKDGEMIMVVVMAEEAMVVEEDMTKVTVIKDMTTRDPLVVAMVVAIIIIMVAMEDTEEMDMIIMVDQEKVDMAVEDMLEMLRELNWSLAKFKALMEIMTLNMVQSILKLAILVKYLEMAIKQEKVIMMRMLDQSQRIQRTIL